MKKILSLLTAFLLIGTLSFAQEAVKTTNQTAVKAKTCTPTKACAKAMGMSLKECKKICGNKTAACTKAKTATAATDSKTTPLTKLVSKKGNVSPTINSQNCDPKACAKSCGISIAECEKKCGSKNSATQTTSNVKLVSQKLTKTACCKASKCCKKGLPKNTSTASN